MVLKDKKPYLCNIKFTTQITIEKIFLRIL